MFIGCHTVSGKEPAYNAYFLYVCWMPYSYSTFCNSLHMWHHFENFGSSHIADCYLSSPTVIEWKNLMIYMLLWL